MQKRSVSPKQAYIGREGLLANYSSINFCCKLHFWPQICASSLNQVFCLENKSTLETFCKQKVAMMLIHTMIAEGRESIAEYCLRNREKVVKEASYFSDPPHFLPRFVSYTLPKSSFWTTRVKYDRKPTQIYSNLPNKNRLYLSMVFFLPHMLQI